MRRRLEVAHLSHLSGLPVSLVTLLAAATVIACSVDAGPSSHATSDTCAIEQSAARLQPARGAYFGVNLDWSRDSPASYSRRLGRTPALYVAFAQFPFDKQTSGYVDDIVDQVGKQQGMLMLTLEPNGGLSTVTESSAKEIALRLASYNARNVPVFLRFGHEMNGSWYPWAQKPAEFARAFREVASAVHKEAALTAMVWAPNYGGGYPFRGGPFAAGPGAPGFPDLDTNHDGDLSALDDPYAPYYPGDDAVDWVGMSLYHWGNQYPWGENELPERGKFSAELTGQYNGAGGDERSLPNFYAVYVDGHHKPLAITETAAFYSPGAGGADEAALKQLWWEQVLSPEVFQQFPRLAMINWFEWSKYETEVRAVVDWTVTRDPLLLNSFRQALANNLRFADAGRPCG